MSLPWKQLHKGQHKVNREDKMEQWEHLIHQEMAGKEEK